MDRELREKITKELQNETKSRVELPEGFLFEKIESGVRMYFQSEKGMGLGDKKKNINMQGDAAAFEAWALAIYVHCLHGEGKVCLEIPDGISWDLNDLYKYPHYSRFLYRALRFSEQHPWFDISTSKRLSELAGNFKEFLNDGKHSFINHAPGPDETGEKDKLESIAENRFKQDGSPLENELNGKIYHGKIYNQLPVNLFQKEGKSEKGVFTGGSSAIDLWTVCGDALNVIELKARNSMAGALTEIFFYANYAYDMFIDHDNTFNPKVAGKGRRGYQTLSDGYMESSLKKVCAYLLLDKCPLTGKGSIHPLINDAVLKELNEGAARNKRDITYGLLKYQLGITVNMNDR